MQTPKEISQNKYLQHLTRAHWTCSTAAAVGVGHEDGNNLYTFFNSSSLFAFDWKFCWTMFMFISLGLSFLHVWCLKLFWHLFCRQKPCRLQTKNIFYESLKRPAAGATFEHLDCRSKNITSTNLKSI